MMVVVMVMQHPLRMDAELPTLCSIVASTGVKIALTESTVGHDGDGSRVLAATEIRPP
jgi:hypothetical protein